MTPSDFGLPSKFQSYREAQEEALLHTLADDRRITAMQLPTGIGKSLIAATIAKHMGRTMVLTGTLGLMRQYELDFNESGLIDIRGRGNYVCESAGIPDCKTGGFAKCSSQRTEDCPYVQRFNEAKAAEFSTSNYAYWLNVSNRSQTGLGKFDCLILDEAHDVPRLLSQYLDFTIREDEAEQFDLPLTRHLGEGIAEWSAWAVKAETILKARISTNHNSLQRAREEDRLEQLTDRLKRIQTLNEDNWVIEKCEGHARYGRYWRFDCVWPGQYAEMLFQHIPRIILMSGTLRPYTLGLLGVKKKDYSFRAWPRVFPANRAPFYHIKTCKMKGRWQDMKPADLKKWVDTIDSIIEPRIERKGLVHTVSYARQQLLMERSKFSRYFRVNTADPDSDSASEVVAKHKKAKGPSVLVSPSMSTGWDFPYGDAEWGISTKVPFPDMTSKVMQRRKLKDPDYMLKMAAQELGQQIGRPYRAFDDRAELFITDDQIEWFRGMAKPYLPDGFSVTTLLVPPSPGKRWNEK